MTLSLPDPLVVRPADSPGLGEDQGKVLSPWSVQRNFERVAKQFPLGPDNLHFGGTVTSLPTGEGIVEGWEVNYVHSRGLFRFKYLPSLSGTYPWYCIGGTPLAAEVAADEGTASATYAALATAGPTVTLPLAGDWDITTGAYIYGDSATARLGWMSYDIGGTGAVDADGLPANISNGIGQNSNMKFKPKTALGAVALTAKYKSAITTTQFSRRTMTAMPVRVTG